MKLTTYDSAPGGFMVTVEIENAYTDGTSRFDRVFLPYDDVAGRDEEHILAALVREVRENPLANLVGRSLDRIAPAPPREPLADQLARIEEKVETRAPAAADGAIRQS